MTEIAVVTQADRQRGRMLLWAVLVAAIAVVLAIAAVTTNAPSATPTSLNEKMFPGLGEAAAKAVSIKIQAPTLFATLNKGADGKWVVADRSNYPASDKVVRALVISMAELTLVEQRTSDPSRQAALELTNGKDGLGNAVTITAADGSTLAALVAGKVQGRGVGTTAGTLFVRRAGEDQTWLARGAVAIPASIGAVLDKTLYTLDPQRLKSITVALNGQKPYTLSRATPDAKTYALDAVPPNKEIASPEALGTAASAVAGLTFDDVLKTDAAKMEKPSIVTAETFDGLVIKITLSTTDPNTSFGEIEASVDAQQAAAASAPAAGAAKPDPTAEAAAINARVKGWAYKMPGFVTANLAPPLDTLLKDKAAPAAPPAPGEPVVPGAAPARDGAAPAEPPTAGPANPKPAPKPAPKTPPAKKPKT